MNLVLHESFQGQSLGLARVAHNANAGKEDNREQVESRVNPE